MSILVGEPLFFALTLYIVRKNFMYLKLWINYACFRRKCHILLGNMMMVWAFFPPRRFLMKTTTFGPQSSSIVQLISVETFPSVSCSPVIIISDVKAESHPARQWHYLIKIFKNTHNTHFFGEYLFMYSRQKVTQLGSDTIWSIFSTMYKIYPLLFRHFYILKNIKHTHCFVPI